MVRVRFAGFGQVGTVAAIAAVISVTTLVAGQQGAPVSPLANVAAFNDKAPDVFRASFEASMGTFIVEVHRPWAPNGADRFYNLVKRGFYDQCRFFRVVPGFVAQFGINGDPAVSAAWSDARIPPDRARQSNTRGRVTFAQATSDTRTTQVFINFGNNSRLDIDGFAPIGEVVSSMVLVERVYSEYGEGPEQSVIERAGNEFLIKYLPRMDYIKRATIISTSPAHDN